MRDTHFGSATFLEATRNRELDAEDNSRYFYIIHRPSDGNKPRPEQASKILNSGGVKPGGFSKTDEHVCAERKIMQMLNLPPYSNFREDGADKRIVSFLKQLYDPMKGVDSETFKRLVAWYYLDSYNRKPILSFANENELVFRVPVGWLRKYAASCLESPPITTYKREHTPYAFLTTQVVPLEYRITNSTPLLNEETRKMSALEVGDLIYNAHQKINQDMRNEEKYVEMHRNERDEQKKQEEREATELPSLSNINPF